MSSSTKKSGASEPYSRSLTVLLLRPSMAIDGRTRRSELSRSCTNRKLGDASDDRRHDPPSTWSKFTTCHRTCPWTAFAKLPASAPRDFYEIVKQGAIRIRKNGRFTTVPVEDLYRFLRGDQVAAWPHQLGARGSVPRQRYTSARRMYPGCASGAPFSV